MDSETFYHSFYKVLLIYMKQRSYGSFQQRHIVMMLFCVLFLYKYLFVHNNTRSGSTRSENWSVGEKPGRHNPIFNVASSIYWPKQTVLFLLP